MTLRTRPPISLRFGRTLAAVALTTTPVVAALAVAGPAAADVTPDVHAGQFCSTGAHGVLLTVNDVTWQCSPDTTDRLWRWRDVTEPRPAPAPAGRYTARASRASAAGRASVPTCPSTTTAGGGYGYSGGAPAPACTFTSPPASPASPAASPSSSPAASPSSSPAAAATLPVTGPGSGTWLTIGGVLLTIGLGILFAIWRWGYSPQHGADARRWRRREA